MTNPPPGAIQEPIQSCLLRAKKFSCHPGNHKGFRSSVPGTGCGPSIDMFSVIWQKPTWFSCISPVYLPSLFARTSLNFWNSKLGFCILPSSSISYSTSFSFGCINILRMCQPSATTSVLWQELGQMNVFLIEWMAFWEMMAILFNRAAWAMKRRGEKRGKTWWKIFTPWNAKNIKKELADLAMFS